VKNVFLVLSVVAIYGCNGQANTPDMNAITLTASPVSASNLTPIEVRHYRTEVSEFIDSAFGPRPFNGSILVAKNGEILYEKYSGFWDPRIKRDSISPSTPFHLA
jgi:hypothetical protein